MKLILLSLGVLLLSAMGSSEFSEMKCLGKNKLHLERFGIGLPNIENLNELNFGKAEGNGEAIMSLADDTKEYISTQIREIRKTQTHCLEYEDAIHMRFCEEVLPKVQSTTCENTAKEALTQYLEYYSRIRERQEPSFEILSVTTRSISYHQRQNEGFVKVSYRPVDPNGLKVKYGTQHAQVLVKRISEKNCSAVDILIH